MATHGYVGRGCGRVPRRIKPWHTGALCMLHALTSVIMRGNVKLQLDCTVVDHTILI